VTANVVATQTANTRCGLLSVANAAGVAFDSTFANTPWRAPFGQADSAIRRGHAFESKLKDNNYTDCSDSSGRHCRSTQRPSNARICERGHEMTVIRSPRGHARPESASGHSSVAMAVLRV
jgi:hypothetical protein